MEYKINPAEISRIFVVPASVADDDLRLAGGAQLKALLWTLRHAADEETDDERMSADTGISPPDFADAMQFWIERGVIVKDGDPAEASPRRPAGASSGFEAHKPPVSVPVPVPVPVTVKPAELSVSKPGMEQIAARCRESEELRELFGEVQAQLGRTIGYDGQATLLMMYDTYGLPVSVIMMAVEYAVSQGKTSLKAIAGIGKLWCEKEIDTLEKAIDFIEEMNSCDGVWERFRELTGLPNPKPTAKQRAFLLTWTRDWGFSLEMIYLAYEEMADHTQKFSMQYIDKVLNNWHSSGIRTADDVDRAKRDFEAGRKPVSSPAKAKKTAEQSYDIDEYERLTSQTVPEYKKRTSD